jgi:death-on-curing protein
VARASETLTIDEIVEMNRLALNMYGGLPFAGENNFANESTLLYTLEALDGEIYGEELYPTIEKKAAALGWKIMAGHVFNDGNKRTGLLACITFLELNGLDLQISFDNVDAEAVSICEGVADRKVVSLEEFTQWIETRAQPIE